MREARRMTISDLILETGMAARASGILVEQAGEVGLLHHQGFTAPGIGLSWESAKAVQLISLGRTALRVTERHRGQLVTATGTWDGAALRDPVFSSWSPGRPDEHHVPPHGGRPVVSRAQLTAQAAVRKSGALLSLESFQRRDGTHRFVAVARDEEAVAAALGPVYDGALTVVPTRWTRAELDEASQSLLSAAEGLVLWFGEWQNEHHELVFRATVKYVTEEIATAFNRAPRGAVELLAFIQPQLTA